MRLAFISDLHANLPAWEAVAGDINRQGIDRLICLGDVVGYGPCPEEVLSSVRTGADYFVLGNHDAVACGLMEPEGFSEAAVQSLAWTRSRLSRQNLDCLRKAPLVLNSEGFGCVHGEGTDPGAFYYLESETDARDTWKVMPQTILFVGHTHIPAVHRLDANGDYQRMNPAGFGLQPGCRYIVNTGSIGLPRNGDYRASYVIFDEAAKTLSWRLVPYKYEEHLLQVRKQTGSSAEAEWLYRRYLEAEGRETGGLDGPRSGVDDYQPDKTILVRAPSRGQLKVTRKHATTVSRSQLERAADNHPARLPQKRRRVRWGPGTFFAGLVAMLVCGLVAWDGFLNPSPFLRHVRRQGVPAAQPYVSQAVRRLPDVLLSELQPVEFTSGQGEVQVNLSVDGGPIRMEGDLFQYGFGVNAESDLVYDLDPAYRRFMAVIGLDDGIQDANLSSVTFEVWAEGLPDDVPLELYRSSVFRQDGLRRASIVVDLPAEARRIRLRVGDADDGSESDHANWANAGFMVTP